MHVLAVAVACLSDQLELGARVRSSPRRPCRVRHRRFRGGASGRAPPRPALGVGLTLSPVYIHSGGNHQHVAAHPSGDARPDVALCGEEVGLALRPLRRGESHSISLGGDVSCGERVSQASGPFGD